MAEEARDSGDSTRAIWKTRSLRRLAGAEAGPAGGGARSPLPKGKVEYLSLVILSSFG